MIKKEKKLTLIWKNQRMMKTKLCITNDNYEDKLEKSNYKYLVRKKKQSNNQHLKKNY